MKDLILICCLHGNEGHGLKVCKRQSLFPFILANEKALKEKRRFIDVDLNRCFPGKKEGNHEEKLAFEILDKIKKFEYVLDLHSSSNKCPVFGIITKPNKEKIEFARRLGLSRLVIMPESFASGKALIDFVNCGISIEIGPHERNENVGDVLKLINNFASKTNYSDDIEIFEVFDIIKKENEKILINNLEHVTRGQIMSKGNGEQRAEFDFMPILVNEKSYGDTLCLACRKVDFINEKAGIIT